MQNKVFQSPKTHLMTLICRSLEIKSNDPDTSLGRDDTLLEDLSLCLGILGCIVARICHRVYILYLFWDSQ